MTFDIVVSQTTVSFCQFDDRQDVGGLDFSRIPKNASKPRGKSPSFFPTSDSTVLGTVEYSIGPVALFLLGTLLVGHAFWLWWEQNRNMHSFLTKINRDKAVFCHHVHIQQR